MNQETKMFATVQAMFEQSNTSVMNENANKDSRLIPTQRDLLAGSVSREYALTQILPDYVAQAHKTGLIHYHDLDYAPFFPMFNCMLIDLKGMFTNGFRMGNAEIETPRSISTACAITAQIIAQVASHIYGGNTIDRIDEVLAPFVRMSYNKHLATGRVWMDDEATAASYATKMVEKECYDAFQSLEYEINTLHTANGQTPFTTFGFGLGTCWESRLIQQSILKVRSVGLGKNKKTAVFPKLVFSIRDGVNHKQGDPNYDIKQLALDCASKRMYPDILNYDKAVEITGSFKAPMGCRSFLGVHGDELAGRNNLGVVSINLPKVAMTAKRDGLDFWNALQAAMDIAKAALMTRIKRLEGVKASVAPILYTEGACGVRLSPDDEVLEIFKHGRASISMGFIGLHETVNALFQDDEQHPFDSKQKQDMAHAIVEEMRRFTDNCKAETGYGFSLYSTPSESLCDRFCRLDVEEFGIVPGVTDKGYYTNSFHLDVRRKVTPIEKIDFEAKFPVSANGGFISYVELPNMRNNLRGLERIWDYTYSRIPYFGGNSPIDYCGECDFSGETTANEEGFSCPNCGNHNQETLSVTRRVCGYLGSPDARPFNKGKQREVMNRVKHG